MFNFLGTVCFSGRRVLVFGVLFLKISFVTDRLKNEFLLNKNIGENRDTLVFLMQE